MIDHSTAYRDPDPEVDRELQAHGQDAAQLQADVQRYRDDLHCGPARPEDADRLAALAARISRQAHRITGLRDGARRAHHP
ncbi:hypothetical protein [Kitasatospora phosalacinea]|uniref:Uncharacterized protein n=1 Tax=Kitasatospora phosalacinea TaxID=2065 RepID=A0A9W6PNN1_9ACTN|nr:hypothetical protein [Kitasatospora phosalacinea]GLW58111.1 hypothetical protein Kpho01_61220 [Kitasatospora phosalacinea]